VKSAAGILAAYSGSFYGDPGPSEPPSGPDIHQADNGTQAEDRWVDGARFVLDQPPNIPAVWGEGSQVLWAEGEALMIAGGQGLGKTTLAGQLVRALLGIGDDRVLGLPVAYQGEPLLYLGMDRPRQIARSLGRQFSEADRKALGGLLVRPGPPPADLAAHPTLLAAMAEEFKAKVVVVDSLKDAAIGLSDDQVGAAYNRSRQLLLNSGVQLLELHHVVKRGARPGDPITSVADIYGSTWLTSGAGSVVLLHGEPGDPIVGFRHVKQPAEEIGPYRLLHDQAAGALTIEHGVDFVALVRATGVDGLTAKAAAAAVTEKPNPSRAEIEKARRRLDHLVAAGVLTRVEGDRGGGDSRQTTAWFLAATEQSRSITEYDKPAGQSNHALFGMEGNHE
jgi:replicative DNA helicase